MNNEDKRQHQRIDSLNLSYVCVDAQEVVINEGMGRTLNVSESGILLEVHFPIEPNNLLTLSLALDDKLVDLRGQVVHCTSTGQGDKYQAGVRFINIDAEALEALKVFIDFFNQSTAP